MSQASSSNDYKAVLKNALMEIKKMRAKLDAYDKAKYEPIAVVSLACRFPGKVHTPEQFWQLLQRGEDAITEVPPSRWNIEEYYDPNPNAPGKMYTRHGGFLENIDQFDASFFGITPNEAKTLDPQQRMLLEVCWEALENAGQDPSSLKESPTGVFMGVSTDDYSRLEGYDMTSPLALYAGTSNAHSVVSGRISYLLGLQGPNFSVDTACSSSLVTIHLACQSLRLQECNLALAGGVNAILHPDGNIYFSKARMMSPDGRCKTFDASANGYVRSEGCGVVVLKRLSDALSNKDHIYGVIRGSAINHDGPSSGLTVPNGTAQQKVIRQALAQGKLEAHNVDYVECHGTGTSLGDPIEVRALWETLGKGRSADNPLLIGSAKTNIGHLEAAAGIAGFIKLVLSLYYKKIPAHLHLKEKTPHLPWSEMAIEIPTSLVDWKAPQKNRLGAVSSFGFSGTNGHILVEEAPAQESPVSSEEKTYILTLSAKKEESLLASSQTWAKKIQNANASLADICFSSHLSRSLFSHRLAVVASSHEEMASSLEAFAQGEKKKNIFYRENKSSSLPKRKVTFLFTGQGSQYPQMGRELWEKEKVFRESMEKSAEILCAYLEVPLLEVLYGEDPEKQSLVHETAYTQPALFALEYAIAQLWQSWGIRPNLVMGHSIGEYVAACVAGVFSVEDGLKLIAQRGKLMQSLPREGKMAACATSLGEIEKVIEPYSAEISIAAVNGPQQIVISGQTNRVEQVAEKLQEKGIKVQYLQVSHAFHSPLMEPILDQFTQAAEKITYQEAKIPLLSNLTGKMASPGLLNTSQYWTKHLREAVQFFPALASIPNLDQQIFLEVGPHPILLGMGQLACLGNSALWLSSLRRKKNDQKEILQSLATFYLEGFPIAWAQVDQISQRHFVPLPTYSFSRKSYWLGDIPQKKTSFIGEKLGKKSDEKSDKKSIEELFYELSWKEENPSSLNDRKGGWVIFSDQEAGPAIAQKWRAKGISTLVVKKGENYSSQENTIILNPCHKKDWQRLGKEQIFPQGYKNFLHLWSLDSPAGNFLSADELEKQEKELLQGVLHLNSLLSSREEKSFLSLVTRGTQKVEATERSSHILGASLWGLGRALPQEQVYLTICLADIDAKDLPGSAAFLEKRMLQVSPENQIALRNSREYILRMQKSSFSTPSSIFSFSPDKTYIVTGALGGLARKFIPWMQERGAKHLALLDYRSPETSERELWESKDKEGLAHCYQVNLAEKKDLSETWLQIQKNQAPIGGIIHTAGQTGSEKVCLDQTWAEFSIPLEAKLKGTWNLHELTLDRDIDFFVVFSSMFSLYPLEGRSSYAAANSFQDSFSFYRQSLGLPTLNVNWGSFTEVGMAATTRDEKSQRLSQILGFKDISPEQGIRALDQALASKQSRLLFFYLDWKRFFRRFPKENIPPFFEFLSDSTSFEAKKTVSLEVTSSSLSDQREKVKNQLLSTISQLMGVEASEVDPQVSFLDLGGDSLLLIQAAQIIEEDFSINLSFQQLMDDINNLEDLVDYVFAKIPKTQENVFQDIALSDASFSHEGAEGIIARQLDLMAQQLQILQGKGNVALTDHIEERRQDLQKISSSLKKEEPKVISKIPEKNTAKTSSSANFSPVQERFIEQFIQRYVSRTGRSKEHTQKYRQVLADKRAHGGFASHKKEIIYPIVGKRSQKGRIWDLDDNEYVDVSMGFGVHLFGHDVPFLQEAFARQLKEGAQIGPQSYQAGEVAAGIAELTGVERVTFCNSGTEAVMSALRIARTKTGKRKVVIFSNSYHGGFDGILAYASAIGRSLPLVLGVPPSLISDILVLEYGSSEALEIIKNRSSELAAVLVEPVQSRRPDFRPSKFLQELRSITEKSSVALIFDEVLLGFRIHQGGAQAWFNIKADLVTYGKIIGGGIPIGVVAGTSEYMDSIDGGFWQYGDDSAPHDMTTFFGGTFNKNPLAMAGASAVIKHFKSEGPELQEKLNWRTSRLIARLNDYFMATETPIRVVRFGSLFRFVLPENTGIMMNYPTYLDLFFYLMIEKGIYIWEGRVCFLCTSHSEEDIERIVAATKSATEELRKAEFFPPSEKKTIPVSRFFSSSISSSEESKLRLFCFPYAGGGASAFRTWVEKLAPTIEVCPIQLPGRENRLKETPYEQWEKILLDTSEALASKLDIPFAFYGHSFGGLLAFELAHRIRQDKGILPCHLFVAGHRAPQLPDKGKQIHHLCDQELIVRAQEVFGYTSEEIEINKPIFEALLPTIRADSTLCENYFYSAQPPLDCPLTVFSGSTDIVSEEELLSWKEQTTGQFDYQKISGGHLFIEENPQAVLDKILEKLLDGSGRVITRPN